MRLPTTIVVAIAGALLGVTVGCGTKPGHSSGQLLYDVGSANGAARGGLFVVDDDGGNRDRLTSLPPTSVSYAQWSPKGGTILFESDLNSAEEFWTIQADGAGLRQIAVGSSASWSPDGREIAIIEGNDEIVIVDRNGEPRRTIHLGLARDESPDIGAAWSPDGSEIAIDVLDASGNGRIALVAADGSGPAKSLGKRQQGVSEQAAAWSPDGKEIAFIRVAEDASNGNQIWIMRRDGSGRRQIAAGADDVAWSDDGTSLIFTGSYPRPQGLYRVSAAGGKVRRIGPVPAGGLVDKSREPGGKRVLHLEKGGLVVSRPDGSGKKLLTEPHEDGSAHWSPDGTRIAFTRGSEAAGKGWDVYVMRADGTGERRVSVGGLPVWLRDGRLLIQRSNGFSFPNGDFSVRFHGHGAALSPDGTSFAFVRDRTVHFAPTSTGENSQPVQSTLFVERLDGTGLRVLAKSALTPQAPSVFDDPVWAPDGRSILLQERDPGGDGSGRIQQVSVPQGDQRTVARDHGSDIEDFSVSPDSKRIAFTTQEGIDVATLDGGEQKTVVSAPNLYVIAVGWSPDGGKLAYVNSDTSGDKESAYDLYVIDADGSHRRLVSTPGDSVGSFDWRLATPSR